MKKTITLLLAGISIVGTVYAQYYQQHPKLVASGLSITQAFGSAVSLSADAATAIVGAWGGTNGATGQAVIMNRNVDNTWSQGQILVGTGAVGGANQGNAVAISADGNTAIIGGPSDNNEAGAAWIYTRSAGVWTQQAKLTGTGATGKAFQGFSVALSADGNTAVIGGPADNNAAGAAWVFTRSGGNWAQTGTKLVGSGGEGFTGYQQGFSVAVSGNGSTIAVGAPYQGYGGHGAVWVYVIDGGNWVQQALFKGEVNYALGTSLAFSNDGSTLVMGAARNFDYVGAAYVAKWSGAEWRPYNQALRGDLAVGKAQQGGSVAISSNGNTIVIGGGATTFPGANATVGVGACWVFKYDDSRSIWEQEYNKYVGTGNSGNSQQGHSVSISADGNTFITGGPADNSSTGAVWVFSKTIPPVTSVNEVAHISCTISPNPAKNTLHIRSSRPLSNELLTIEGKIVMPRNNNDVLDIAALPAGIYLMNLYNKEGLKVKVEKIIKE